MPIRVLPRQLVDQIAAGEVVERPASAVKELVENALDAGATRIEVLVEGGGADRIVVADDGGGIPAGELPLAVASHATSKIASSEDLSSIATMGFRGEALASIASVSRLAITSRRRGDDAAARLDVEGGQAGEVRPAGAPLGTTVEVRQLFFNVPARRKFLRTAPVELGRVQDVLESVAICRPGVAFRLVADGRTRMDLAATDDPAMRVRAVLGDELADDPLPISAEADAAEHGPVTVWGLAARPAAARATARALRFALNGRAVLDRTLVHAVREAYRGLIDPGRTPVAFVAIEMDPALVDVNVHPAKTEVRFRQPSFVHQLVMRAVRDALRAADLVPAFQLGSPRPGAAPAPAWSAPRPGSVGDRAPSMASVPPTVFGRFAAEAADAAQGTRIPAPPVVEVAPASADAAADEPTLHANRTARRVMQVHGSYLVVEDRDGILVVDQHALHERAMFEELKARIAAQPLESQRMLVPAMLQVDPRAAEAVESAGALLARIGIDASAAGPRAVAVHGYPTFLLGRGVQPEEFVPALLERLVDEGAADVEAALHEVLDMMACKAAVKAGDRLTPFEIEALLDLRERIERGAACPHGRPTSLRISMRDLDRSFGRT
jgi:DNA mismatch repair protein MutL